MLNWELVTQRNKDHQKTLSGIKSHHVKVQLPWALCQWAAPSPSESGCSRAGCNVGTVSVQALWTCSGAWFELQSHLGSLWPSSSAPKVVLWAMQRPFHKPLFCLNEPGLVSFTCHSKHQTDTGIPHTHVSHSVVVWMRVGALHVV